MKIYTSAFNHSPRYAKVQGIASIFLISPKELVSGLERVTLKAEE